MFYKVVEVMDKISEDIDLIYSDEDHTWWHELSTGDDIQCGYEVVVYFKDSSMHEIDPVKCIGLDDGFVYIDNSYAVYKIPHVTQLDLRKIRVVEAKDVPGVYNYKRDLIRTIWKREG